MTRAAGFHAFVLAASLLTAAPAAGKVFLTVDEALAAAFPDCRVERHVWAGWKRGGRDRQRTGVSLALTLVPMVVSGYLLQTAVEESWRRAWVVVHLAASALWLLSYLVHQLLPQLRQRLRAYRFGTSPHS